MVRADCSSFVWVKSMKRIKKKNLNQRNNNLCSPIDIRLQLITLLSYYLIGINNQSKTEVYNTELETFQPPESTKGSEGHISRANSALS